MESVKFDNSNLEVWDLAGQKNSRFFWKNYFHNTNCIMFVIDSGDKKRLDLVKDEFNALLDSKELEGVPFCICANKQDLEHKMTEREIIEALEMDEHMKKREWQIFKTIGKTGEGLDLAFKWIAKQYNEINNLDEGNHLELIDQNELIEENNKDNKLDIDDKAFEIETNKNDENAKDDLKLD